MTDRPSFTEFKARKLARPGVRRAYIAAKIRRFLRRPEPWHDPTYGRIDRDIQERVDAMGSTTLGTRVAIENTLQNRRDREAGR